LKKEELVNFPQNANPTYGQCHKKKKKKKKKKIKKKKKDKPREKK